MLTLYPFAFLPPILLLPPLSRKLKISYSERSGLSRGDGSRWIAHLSRCRISLRSHSHDAHPSRKCKLSWHRVLARHIRPQLLYYWDNRSHYHILLLHDVLEVEPRRTQKPRTLLLSSVQNTLNLSLQLQHLLPALHFWKYINYGKYPLTVSWFEELKGRPIKVVLLLAKFISISLHSLKNGPFGSISDWLL